MSECVHVRRDKEMMRDMPLSQVKLLESRNDTLNESQLTAKRHFKKLHLKLRKTGEPPTETEQCSVVCADRGAPVLCNTSVLSLTIRFSGLAISSFLRNVVRNEQRKVS